MQFAVCLLLTGAAVGSQNAMFKLETRFNDKDLFEGLVLGSPSTCRQHQECALHCAGNPLCSMFSFNQAMKTCQLYGNVGYPTASSPASPGARYYVYKTGWCPQKNSFHMLRAVNICVKLQLGKQQYREARQICEDVGARLIILEDEDKATAVINLLANLDMKTIKFTVGLNDSTTEGEFVWSDGRQMIRDWWQNGEPNRLVGDEDCVFLYDGKLYDYGCDGRKGFICEIPN